SPGPDGWQPAGGEETQSVLGKFQLQECVPRTRSESAKRIRVSAQARSTARSGGSSDTIVDAGPCQSSAMETELTLMDGAEAVDEPARNGSASDGAAAASDDKEQPGPDEGADSDFNSDSSEFVLTNDNEGDVAPGSLSTGDKGAGSAASVAAEHLTSEQIEPVDGAAMSRPSDEEDTVASLELPGGTTNDAPNGADTGAAMMDDADGDAVDEERMESAQDLSKPTAVPYEDDVPIDAPVAGPPEESAETAATKGRLEDAAPKEERDKGGSVTPSEFPGNESPPSAVLNFHERQSLSPPRRFTASLPPSLPPSRRRPFVCSQGTPARTTSIS
ncbi:hypothetical protein THAOC_06557, partial [Thalassiosira oceanica]